MAAEAEVKAEEINWHYNYDVISLSLILYMFSVSETVLKGKSSF